MIEITVKMFYMRLQLEPCDFAIALIRSTLPLAATEQLVEDCDMPSSPLVRTLLVLLLLFPHRGGAEKLTSQQIKHLNAGEVITQYWMIKGTDIGTGKAAGVINAQPRQVMKVVTDVVRYKEYIQRMTESRITRRDSKYYYFFYRIDMPWPVDDYWCETKNWNTNDDKLQIYQRSWSLVQGNFRRNEGYWLVQPWTGGQSLVVYSVKLQIASSLPQSVLNYITKKALPRSVSALRQRVLTLKKKGSL